MIVGMQQLPQELKTMIHHILHRYKFYRLEIDQYHEILELLRQPRTDDPLLIQQYVFRGIVAFNQVYKDQVAPVLASQQVSHLSHQSKALMHKILHEFHFLNSIRAYEMFQERFQQPASLTGAHDAGFNMPFDDELEKARLHYMYYGPYSIYHMNGILPQPQPQTSLTTQSYFQPPQNNFYFQNQPTVPRSSQDETKNIKVGRSGQRGYMMKDQEIQRHTAPTRGRPPKDRKRLLEKYNSMTMSQPLKNLLALYHSEQDISEQRDEQLQFCICRGFLISPYIFKCTQCSRSFHYDCCKGGNTCSGCQLKTKDPFNRVTDTLGLFYLDWWETFNFQVQISFKDCEKICSIGRFEVMVSCSLANKEEITWPDGAVLKVNGNTVFTVPPILAAHQVKRRRDASYFITPYIFGQKTDTPLNLDKMKISLEATLPANSQLRDNRKGIFLFGIFLVEKISIQKLFDAVINDNVSRPTVNPLETQGDMDVEIDHMVVSCFDPYSKQLMETPVKGSLCQHINCFDLQTYLTFQFHSSDRLWKCPLCRKDARTLQVDKFQLHILEEIKNLQKLPHRITYYKGGKIDLEQAQGDSSSHSN